MCIRDSNRAGKGLGVKLFNNEEELNNYVTGPLFEPSIDGITLLQEYIKPKDGRIRRSEFINQKFLYTVSIDSSDGFQLCPADECNIGSRSEQLETSNKFEITDPLPLELQNMFEKFLNSCLLYTSIFNSFSELLSQKLGLSSPLLMRDYFVR